MKPLSSTWKRLHRTGLALSGVMFTLFGVGVAILGIDDLDRSIAGALVGWAAGAALIGTGVSQLYGAFVGQIPRWFNEIVAGESSGGSLRGERT